jgi:anti-sigma factor RsiW
MFRMSTIWHRTRFRLDHRWAPRRMSDYLDGELASSGRTRMDRHVGECEECRRVLAGLRAMLDQLQRLPGRGVEVDAVQIVTAVRARLREPPGS